MVREGLLYRSFLIEGVRFDIHYGYYSEAERNLWPPTPVFPDFTVTPMYTSCGMPFVTAEQDVCEHFSPKPLVSGEDWCDDCVHFKFGEEIIGICQCKARVRKNE